MNNRIMRKWFGLRPQDGAIISLGAHESFDDADTIETGGENCIWIWDEVALRALHKSIEELLT